jgi:hypothetical protein
VKKLPVDYPTRIALGFKAGEFRKDLDELLKRHGAKMQMGWAGKRCYFQVVFPATTEAAAVTLMTVTKDRKVRYVEEVEEND